jgi:hypothetical protein
MQAGFASDGSQAGLADLQSCKKPPPCHDDRLHHSILPDRSPELLARLKQDHATESVGQRQAFTGTSFQIDHQTDRDRNKQQR